MDAQKKLQTYIKMSLEFAYVIFLIAFLFCFKK